MVDALSHQHTAEQSQPRGGRRRVRLAQRSHLERHHHHHHRKRRRQQEEEPQRGNSHHADPRDIQRRARDHHKQPRVNRMAPRAKPRRHLPQIKYEQRRINRHVKNTGRQRKPRFLKSPEISQTAPHPRVVSAFLWQRARQLPDHERRRQAPQHRQEKQNQNPAPIARAVNDLFRPVRAAGHHEKCRSH
jgi:hypothetical protein